MALIQTLLLPLLLVASAAVGDGWLGIRLAEAERPTIEEVIPDSPAAKAGLRHGDVILSIDGKRTRTVESLIAIMRERNAGNWIKGVVQRGDKKVEFKARLVARPVEGREPVREERPAKKPTKVGKGDRLPAFLGVEIEEARGGIVVTDLVQGAPAARSGLRRGDRLSTFNGKPVRNLEQLDKIMKGVYAADEVRLGVTRDGRRQEILLTAAAKPGAKPIAEAPVKAVKKKAPTGKKVAKKPQTKQPPKKAPAKKAPAKKAPAKKAPAKKAPARETPTKKTVQAAPRAGTFADNLEVAIAKARRSGRPLLVVFGAEWCVNCQTLKKSLQHSSLQRMLGQYERVWIDTDRQSALADKYDVESLPHTFFLTKDGKTHKSIVGYQPPQILAPLLRAGLTDRSAAAVKRAPKKARTAKAQPDKRAAPKKKAQPAKAQPKKAQPKKAQPVKAQPRQPDRRRPVRRPGAAAGNMAAELQRLRAEVQRLRAEQRKQSEMLQRILRELQRKK